MAALLPARRDGAHRAEMTASCVRRMYARCWSVGRSNEGEWLLPPLSLLPGGEEEEEEGEEESAAGASPM